VKSVVFVDGTLAVACDPELDPPQEDRMKAVVIAPHAAAQRIRFRGTMQLSCPKGTVA
jgi:hypothetical protein